MSPPLAAEPCASRLTEQRHAGAVANRDTCHRNAETLGALVAPAPIPAPASPASYTVRATSVADRTAFGEATVTVTAGSIWELSVWAAVPATRRSHE